MRTLDGARWKPFKPERMLRTYERVLQPLPRNARLLELGVYQGHSLSMSADCAVMPTAWSDWSSS
jgi:hypothetical protein